MLKLTYYPDKGFSINSINLDWSTERKTARRLLGNNHEESNTITDLSEFHNGSNEHNITQRRGIYGDYNNGNNYFFLNYDKDDLLREVEVHHGLEIRSNGVSLNFEMNIQEALSKLKVISDSCSILSGGEYLFTDLKMTIADSQTMGGDNDLLCYFYCSKDVEHLIIVH